MPENSYEPHDVFNQSPVFEDVNLYQTDRALKDAVHREGAGWADGILGGHGRICGSADTLEHGRLANENPPVLRTFDTKGRRIDRVDYHPSYHALMALSIETGLHASPWEHLADGSAPVPGATVARAAGFFMACQAEAGHTCPVTMTHAAIPALMADPNLAKAWVPRIVSRHYDKSFVPAEEKLGVTFGMGMTEKQGGTDVRSNTTRALPTQDGFYRLDGHKWFLSAPMSDAFLMLAQAPAGLSCFLVPRILEEGKVNALHLQRLKPKLGNRSNASSEVELHGASAWLLGEEGRGVRNIIEMATYTRLDCAISSAGLMRMALAQALNHCAHRTVFQKKLVDQPMMQKVLADMAIESEAATALVMRLARAYDNAIPGQAADPLSLAYKRIMTPVAKYWICKTAPRFAYEAMECLGGNGYVEEGTMARLFREVPVNAIWEGSGNVMCLDVLRVASRESELFELLLGSLEPVAQRTPELKPLFGTVQDLIQEGALSECNARIFVETLVRLAAGVLLVENAPTAIRDGFLIKLAEMGAGETYGALRSTLDGAAIVERAMPAT